MFSTISSAVIVEGLLISGVRADSSNFIVQESRAQPFVSPTNAKVYVVNLHDNTLSIISGPTKTVIGNATTVGKYPAAVTFGSSFSRNTYVVNLHDNTLSIISGPTKTVIGNAIFVSNGAGETTFSLSNAKGETTVGLSNSKSYIVATHKITLSNHNATKASKVAVKTLSGRGIANNNAKAVTAPSGPPMMP
jgi:YVTN family beta-propeller protein